MVSRRAAIALVASLAQAVFAATPLYGQCGGSGWTGDKTCVAGACCQFSNDWYSQCLPCTGNQQPAPTTTAANPPAATTTKAPSASPSGTFTNPVLWEDLADLDVFRVDDAFYYSASTMAYSPGAPILRSYDLVNWEYIGHSVPTLGFGSKYDLTNGQRAYVKGIWASTMRYRKSNNKWYWIGCIEFGKTYVYTAPAVTGPWTQAATMNTCLYDAGLFIDDDDSMYVAYGNTQLRVAKLAADGLSIASDRQVYDGNSGGQSTLEGSRMYKRNGQYYILVTHPASQEWVLKGSSPQGSYSIKVLANAVRSPIGGGNPHQGGLVDTPGGAWYYMSFIDAYPGGRVPALAPVSWGGDGFPTLQLVNGAWGASYPMPLPARPVASSIGTDAFAGTALGPAWEWNHNPDTARFSVNNGLRLSTASVTTDLFQARNTLTRRIHGPVSTATIVLDTAAMADGDRAGLALFRDATGWVGVRNDGGAFSVAMVTGINLDSNWNTAGTGTVQASAAVAKGAKLYLRGTVDIRPGGTRVGQFSYSTDGTNFQRLGNGLTLNNNWTYFIGYRWAIFNYATKALGGSVSVASFTQTVSQS